MAIQPPSRPLKAAIDRSIARRTVMPRSARYLASRAAGGRGCPRVDVRALGVPGVGLKGVTRRSPTGAGIGDGLGPHCRVGEPEVVRYTRHGGEPPARNEFGELRQGPGWADVVAGGDEV